MTIMPPSMLPKSRQAMETGTATSETILMGKMMGVGCAMLLMRLVGLYFNVFHPCIQVFIFVTLTLSFINEATE